MRHAYSIYDLKAKLSQVLKLVADGQQVVVTDRGKPSFEIILFKEKEGIESRLEFFERQGIVKPGKQGHSLQPLTKKPGALERFLDERHGNKK